MTNDAARILVVDDELGMREGCSKVLSMEGFDVETAPDGLTGLKLFRERGDFAVALVDLKMPGMGGLELIEHLKSHDEDVAIFVITAYAAIDTAVEATRRGAYGYIPKPFTPDELLITVRNGLERRALNIEAKRLRDERERRLLELARERSKSSTIINCMADGVIVVNRDRQIVLRNAAVLRPWMLAFVLAALAGRSVHVARLLIPLVALALMPWPAYRVTLGRLPVENHPQREARDCLLHVVGSEALPGVYAQIMEGSFLHSYYFYFRRLGPWEWRNEADDSGLYANLWGAGAARPVLVSDQRYSDFRAHLRDTGDPRSEVSAPMVRFADVLLLLPGRFSACSADARMAAPRRETYGR